MKSNNRNENLLVPDKPLKAINLRRCDLANLDEIF